MLKLLKYLKPYLFSVLLCVGLLFLGVNADLALPDYMSRIVNIGIQQSGIDSPVPEALSQATLDKAAFFMSEADLAAVHSAYTSSLPEGFTDLYPASRTAPALALLGEYAKDAALGDILSDAMVRAMAYETAFAELPLPEQLKAMEPFAALAVMPKESRAALLSGIDERIAQYDKSMLRQGAVRLVKAEYERLGADTSKMQSSYILHTGGLMLLISLVSIATTIAVAFLSSRIGAGVSRTLRSDVFSRVESFSSAEFDRFSTASLITRTTNDITQVQMLVVMMLRLAFYAPIMGVGGVIRALDRSRSMSWIIAGAVTILLGMIITVFYVAVPRFKKMQSLLDRLNLVIRENLSGMMVIRAFNTQSHEEARFDRANRDYADNNLFVNRVMVVMMPAMMLIMNAVMLTIVWVGAHEIERAAMQVGDMMAFMQYAMQILLSFIMLSMMFIMLPRASVSAVRISEVLSTRPSIVDSPTPQVLDDSPGLTVEFRDVSFRYPGAEEDVLSDITFTAKPGQTTAFIGSTGSGKSTLINLIPRFYDVTSGEILVGGVDVRQLSSKDLREKIGYIPQKGSLFSGTVRSNLTLGDEDASDELIARSARVAQADGFIAEMADGYESEIAQGGTNVSGGQKQRLSIARALVKDAPLYIFDDSFSALDFKTDSLLRKALKEVTGKSTLLIVGQRISTVMNAEQIIVLDEGKIVGKGTHAALMESCETYREIALSQLSKEELAV